MKRAVRSGLHSVHPGVVFLYYGGLMLLMMLQYHPMITLGAMILTVSLALQLGLRVQVKRFFIFYPIAFVVMVGLNVLFNHRGRHILGYVWDQPITLEAMLYGLQSALMIGTIWVIFISYQAVLSPPKFLYLFAKLLPRIALMTSMALRFIPQLLRRARDIADVQRTRGIDPRSGSLAKRFRDGVHQLQILMTWSLEDAVETADSMLARGYGSAPRSSFIPYRWSQRDRWLLLPLSGLLIGCLAVWMLGLGRMELYPQLQGAWLTLDGWLTAIVVWSYASVPVWLEGRERIRWRNYPSST